MGKKRGKPNIAPLQPPTLAAFRPWGSSAGAGRAGLPAAKIGGFLYRKYASCPLLCQATLIQIKFHAADFYKAIGSKVFKNSLLKFQRTLVQHIVFNAQFCACQVYGIYLHQYFAVGQFFFKILMHDI